MEVELEEIPIQEKPVLQKLMEFYLYDYSEFSRADLGEHGVFGYKRLDHYWTDEGRHPFLVRVDQRLAGFVLVSQWEECSRISEFFIMRKYRRKGVGAEVARRIFARFPGQWEVGQETSNLPAQAFWRKTIADCTEGDFEEIRREKGPAQHFTFPPQGAKDT